MTRDMVRHDLVVLAISAIAWGIFGYWPTFHVLAFWIAPPIICSAVTILVVCDTLEASPPMRPWLALIPPAVVLPVAVVRLVDDGWAGQWIAALIVYPALATALLYFAFALVKQRRA